MTNAIAPMLAQIPDLLPVFVVIVLLAIVLILPRMLKRKTGGGGESPLRPSASSAVRAKEQMEDLIVKLHDFGREMQAKTDNKIRVLNRLIEEANEKIREMEAHGISPKPPAGTDGKSPETKSGKQTDGTGDVAETPSRPETGKYTSVYELADAGHDVVSIARHTGLQPGEIELLLELRKARNKDKR